MSGFGENLTPKQETLLSALLTAPTVTEAARIAKVSEPTARRWVQQPQVRAAWLDMRRQVVLMCVQTATRAAIATLLDCLQPKYPPSVRLRAATAILETAMRTVEIGDLAARIEELETALVKQQTCPAGRLYA